MYCWPKMFWMIKWEGLGAADMEGACRKWAVFRTFFSKDPKENLGLNRIFSRWVFETATVLTWHSADCIYCRTLHFVPITVWYSYNTTGLLSEQNSKHFSGILHLFLPAKNPLFIAVLLVLKFICCFSSLAISKRFSFNIFSSLLILLSKEL